MSLETVVEMSEAEFDDHIETQISKERIEGMVRKMKTTEEQISHLHKVRKRWTKADSSIKIIGVTATFILTFVTAIFNVIPNFPAVGVITAVLSSLAAITAVSSESTVLAYTSRKKVLFNNRIRELEKMYNRCYIFYEKARSDKKITNEELTRFYAIFEEK